MPPTVADAVRELRDIVAAAPARFARYSDSEAGAPLAPGKWSRKQILGHLIDSASNNHQRFVRATLAGELIFPAYEQDGWVAVNGYGDEPWERIVGLWKEYNGHLARLMDRIPTARHGALCVVEEKNPVTLEWLMRDYVRHLKHHLAQIDR